MKETRLKAEVNHLEVDIAALHRAVDQCLLKDQRPARRTIRQIKQKMDAQQDHTQLLARLLERIEHSQAIHRQRCQPLTLSYPELPVSERREEIIQAIRDHAVVIIAGETGSGKTTQLPKMCIEAGLGRVGRIAHTQPRRLAARAVAQRIAEEMQCELGTTVGFQVRFSDQSQESTRIKLMTDGILLAQTQHDRFLNEYDAIIIDEAHERSLNIDFLLGYLKQLIPQRPDLKIIITSATIDVQRFSEHFDNAPIIEVSGRSFAVEMRYRPLVRQQEEDDDLTLFEGIEAALTELREHDREQKQNGDVLVFLPGERDIRECAEYLRRLSLPATDILPLYARLSSADQQRIFKPHGGRRVVLATNVAETSLTVPGIRYVIDSGVARISRYSYRSKVQRLPIEAISQASANQRAGRCGRTAPGICIRLYEESDFLSRPAFTDPEIRRTNLAAVVLQMLHLKLGRMQDFPFVDAPDERFIKDGYTLLQELEAVDGQQQLTDIGRQMARIPADPRISRMLIEAKSQQALHEVMIIAAALAVQDPRERPIERQQAADEKHRQWRHDESDFLSYVNLWHGYEEQRQTLTQNQLRKWCSKQFLSYMRLREWRDTHRQLLIICRELQLREQSAPASYEAIHLSLLAGMLSQIGFKGEGQEYLAARQRKMFLFPASALYKKRPKWVMAAELMETSKLYARTVAQIQPEWIEKIAKPLLKYQYFEPHWQQQRGQVVAFEQSTLYGLIINPRKRVNYADKHPEEARAILIQEGLVEQKINTKLPFVRHNQQLLKEVTEYEEKSRRRDLVIDDAYLAAFYHEHLPAHVTSTKTLERWYKTAEPAQQQALLFTREWLLNPAAAGIGANDYPACLAHAGIEYPLRYTFAPGDRDDGVTLAVPLAMLQQVPSAPVEWLVPGFIHEKVSALLKGLPKAVRKLFVPVPNSAYEFLQQADSSQSLYAQLLMFLNRRAFPKLSLDDLLAIELPTHLRMNIHVLADGKVLAQSRDLLRLQAQFKDQSQHEVQTLTDERYQRDDIQTWDFGDLPTVINSTVNGLSVRAFPCLKGDKQQLQLTVEADEHTARRHHRQGLVALFRKALPEMERLLRSDFQKALASSWLLCKGLGTQQSITDDLVDATFQHVFAPLEQMPLYRQQAFEQALEQRSELVAQGQQIIAAWKEWLTLRQQILKAMSGAVSLDRAMAYSDIKAHLEQLMAPGLMKSAPWPQLLHISRYLKAMLYRIDKLQGNLPRDRQSMLEFASVYDDFKALIGDQDVTEPSDYHAFYWLLQEWRVSLFAQPLGTQEPVSLKRLQKRLSELKNQPG